MPANRLQTVSAVFTALELVMAVKQGQKTQACLHLLLMETLSLLTDLEALVETQEAKLVV